MGISIDRLPHPYGENCHFLSEKDVLAFRNRTMMELYGIDPTILGEFVVPTSLREMGRLFDWADRILVH